MNNSILPTTAINYKGEKVAAPQPKGAVITCGLGVYIVRQEPSGFEVVYGLQCTFKTHLIDALGVFNSCLIHAAECQGVKV